MKKYLTALALSLLLASCSESRQPVVVLEKTTMDLHDEAMKAMGPMNATARDLRAALKTTDSLSQRYQDLRTAASAIERADADMMAWMQQYNSPAEDVPVPKALEYLTTQKAAIEKNFNDIKIAAEQGKKMLEAAK